MRIFISWNISTIFIFFFYFNNIVRFYSIILYYNSTWCKVLCGNYIYCTMSFYYFNILYNTFSKSLCTNYYTLLRVFYCTWKYFRCARTILVYNYCKRYVYLFFIICFIYFFVSIFMLLSAVALALFLYLQYTVNTWKSPAKTRKNTKN